MSAEICAADTPITAGPIAHQHAAHALVAPVEARSAAACRFSHKRPDLQRELRDAADEHAPCERDDRRMAVRGEKKRRADDREVEEDGRERGNREPAIDVENPARRARPARRTGCTGRRSGSFPRSARLSRGSARIRLQAGRRATARRARPGSTQRASRPRAACPRARPAPCVSASPRWRRYSAKIGTNACENAPSAKRRRRMLGSRKAASNASICSPAPNAAALRLSRASPVIRDSSVMPLIVETARSRFNGAVPGMRAHRTARSRRSGERTKERAKPAFDRERRSTGESCAPGGKLLLCLVFFRCSRT